MNSAASIKARLRNLAAKEHKPYDYVQTHYMIERLLYRLSISKYADDFVLKGGLLLHVLFAEKARATRDIDFLARFTSNSPENLKAIFTNVCAIKADDAVVFDPNTLTAEAITEGADYHGVRMKLTGFLERSRSVLQFDLGFGDVIVPHPERMVYPSLLGMDEINLWAYSREFIIAEKFQAMLYLAQANSRMKDFFDIYMMASTYDFDGRVLFEAVQQTVAKRATPIETNPIVLDAAFSCMSEKVAQWNAFCKRIHHDELAFDSVLAILRKMLTPIYQSILTDNEFFGVWKHQTLDWE